MFVGGRMGAFLSESTIRAPHHVRIGACFANHSTEGKAAFLDPVATSVPRDHRTSKLRVHVSDGPRMPLRTHASIATLTSADVAFWCGQNGVTYCSTRP